MVWNIIQKVGDLTCGTDSGEFLGSLIVLQEKLRQQNFINLIPSENFTTQAVLDALGSPMQS